jgi:hypothetical protein
MTFVYEKDDNDFDYFNKVNASTDRDVFYTTHFSIKLPKKIVYWQKFDANKFYYEYDSKQIIYIYTAYKNEGKESDKWELKEVNERDELNCLKDYWNERNYNLKLLDVKKTDRITKLYTNGKYEILLYNIKEKNFTSFFELIKTFAIKT